MRTLRKGRAVVTALLALYAIIAAPAEDVPSPEAKAPSLASIPSSRADMDRGDGERRTAMTAFWRHFSIELSLGPTLGLDSPFRGGLAGLGFLLSTAGFEAGCRATLAYDTTFGAALASADLVLGMGPGLRLTVGGELDLAPLLVSGLWGDAILAPLPWPNRFGLAAAVVEFGSSPAKGEARLRFYVDAELSWGAYRVLSSSRSLDPKSVAGLVGFSAGCRLALCLRARVGDG
jgi:hypothetical protein